MSKLLKEAASLRAVAYWNEDHRDDAKKAARKATKENRLDDAKDYQRTAERLDKQALNLFAQADALEAKAKKPKATKLKLAA